MARAIRSAGAATDPISKTAKQVLSIPRSTSAARRRKWAKPDAALDTPATHTWLDLASLVGTDNRPPRIGIGPRPGTHMVCYYNEDSGQYDDCHVVPD